jgi:hypothetical protein
MVTRVTESRTQKLTKKFKIVETYWHDHSLESSWGARFYGTISSSFQLFLGGKMHFLNFSQTSSVLKELTGEVKQSEWFKPKWGETLVVTRHVFRRYNRVPGRLPLKQKVHNSLISINTPFAKSTLGKFTKQRNNFNDGIFCSSAKSDNNFEESFT